MATYLVERHWPGVTSRILLAARETGSRVTEEMSGEGTHVRDLGWFVLPGEGVVYSFYEGPSLAAVRHLNERAGFPVSRIIEDIAVTDKTRSRTRAGSRRRTGQAAQSASVETSVPSDAPKAAREISRKSKIAAIMTTPAVITGLAGAAPAAAVDAVQHAIHDVTAQTASYKPAASGGEYYLGRPWQGVTSSESYYQEAAGMAAKVVEIALRKAGWHDCDAASKRRYVQWILAGNMTPSEAAQVLVQKIFQTNIPPLRELIRIIKKDRPPPDAFRQAMMMNSAFNSARQSQAITRMNRLK